MLRGTSEQNDRCRAFLLLRPVTYCRRYQPNVCNDPFVPFVNVISSVRSSTPFSEPRAAILRGQRTTVVVTELHDDENPRLEFQEHLIPTPFGIKRPVLRPPMARLTTLIRVESKCSEQLPPPHQATGCVAIHGGITDEKSVGRALVCSERAAPLIEVTSNKAVRQSTRRPAAA